MGTPSNPFVATIAYSIPDTLSVILSSPHATFSPSTLTFAPNVTSAPFSVTAFTVGGGIPVTVATVGPVVDWFTPAALGFLTSLEVSQSMPFYMCWFCVRTNCFLGSWIVTPQSFTILAGQSYTVDYAVDVPPNDAITITPSGPGLIFTPTFATLSNGASSVTVILQKLLCNCLTNPYLVWSCWIC